MCDSGKTKTALIEELQTLREGENKYRTLVENLPQKIFLKDRNSVYMSCNDNLARDFKIKSEEIAGKTDYDLFSKELAEKYRADDKRIIETGQTEDIEESYIQEGREVIVHTVKTPVKDARGNVIGILGIFWDITKHKKAEEEIKRAAEEWGRTFNAIADLVFIVDKDFTITKMNKALPEALKLKPEDIIGKKCHELLHKSDKPWPGCPLEKAKKDKQSRTQEVDDPNIGIPLLITTSPIFDDNGKFVGAVHIAKDITERKKAEEELRESEERYKALFQGVAEGIVVADIETKEFKYVNPAICKMLGYTEEELKRRGISDVHLKEDLEYVISEFEAQVRGEKTLSPSIPCLRKDGTIIHADINTANVVIGGRQYSVGFFTDITDRRKAEEELLFKSTLLEAQSETSIDGILVVDSEGKSISFNNNFGRMWNIPQQILDTRDDEKMLQYVLSRLKDPEQFLKRVKYLYAHKNEKSRDEIQFKDGRVFDRYSSPLLNSNNKYYGRVWYFRDVTERKRAEEAYRAIVDHSLQGFEIFQNERVVFANHAMAEITGYTVEEMLAMSSQQVQALVHSEDRTFVWGRHQDRLKGKELPERYEFRRIRKDGTICWLEIHARLIEYQGKPAVQVAYLDITERKRAEEALKKARDELEIRVEQRTADFARVNVQLRSLAAELTLAEERLRRRIATNVHDHVGQNLAISKIKIESLRESATSPELAEDLEEIRDLISQTIESTRSLTFELSPPVLYELGFEAAVEWLVRQTKQQHGVSTEFKGDGKTKPLDNNVRILLFQAVRELLVNVAKHAQAHNVTVSTRRVGNEIRVSVEDDGVGFDISQTGSYDYKTGGFGLFSIRERLGHIGGRLDVESKPGLGTRITLTAPIDQECQNNKEQRK